MCVGKSCYRWKDHPSQRKETLTRLQVVTFCGTAVCGCFILLVSFSLGVARSGRNPSLGMLRRRVMGIQQQGETGPVPVAERPGSREPYGACFCSLSGPSSYPLGKGSGYGHNLENQVKNNWRGSSCRSVTREWSGISGSDQRAFLGVQLPRAMGMDLPSDLVLKETWSWRPGMAKIG